MSNPEITVDSEIQSFVKEEIEYLKTRISRYYTHFTAHAETYDEIVRALPNRNDYSISIDGMGLNISLSGTSSQLAATVRTLRKAGLKPDHRPKVGDVKWSAYWTRGGGGEAEASIWFFFTSTVCHKVKIGTETQEVDIFEVQCEDSGIDGYVEEV